MFTGVSGSGKSSLVFGTIAAESQRMINETYSAFVQGFMPTLARPDVDVLEGLTTAILVDQERMGANARSTVGTATDANAMLRILFSRLGKPHIGSPQAFSFNTAIDQRRRRGHLREGRHEEPGEARASRVTGGMCPRCEGMGTVSDFDLTALYDDSKSLNEGAITIPGYSMEGWYGRIFRGCGYFDPDKPIRKFTKKELARPAPQGADQDQGRRHQPHVRRADPADPEVVPRRRTSTRCSRTSARSSSGRSRSPTCPDCDGTRLNEAARSSKIEGINIADACAMQISDLAEWVRGLDEPSVAPLLAIAAATPSTRSWRSGSATSRSTGRRARCRAARRSAPR